MFQTAHSRLAVVATALWIPAAYLLATEPGYWRDDFFYTVLIGGWLMIWIGVFGVNWITAAPGTPPSPPSGPSKALSFPAIPRPVYYALVLIAIVLVMGLPKALYRFLT